MLLGWPHVSFCVSSPKSFGSGEKSAGQLLCCDFFLFLWWWRWWWWWWWWWCFCSQQKDVFFFKFTHQKSNIDTKNDNPPFPTIILGIHVSFRRWKLPAGRDSTKGWGGQETRWRRTVSLVEFGSQFGRISGKLRNNSNVDLKILVLALLNTISWFLANKEFLKKKINCNHPTLIPKSDSTERIWYGKHFRDTLS